MKKPATILFLYVMPLFGLNIKTGSDAGQPVPAFSARHQDGGRKICDQSWVRRAPC